MSEGESFLVRWSRVKREQAAATSTDTPQLSGPPAQPAPAVDLASLPPIESLGPGSDISAFLSAGVPPELTQAALRSAWLADPAVREFVEIADNQWDFNEPEAIPGFGTLGATEQARNLVAQALTIVDNTPGTPASPEPVAAAPANQVVADPVWQAGATPAPQIDQTSAGTPQKRSPHDTPAPTRRLHGSALPK